MKIPEQIIEDEKKRLLKRLIGKDSARKSKAIIILSLIDHETEDSLAKKLLLLAKEFS